MDLTIHVTKGQLDGLMVFACLCGGISLLVNLFRVVGDTMTRWERQSRH